MAPTLASSTTLSGIIASPSGTAVSSSFTPGAGAVLVVKASSGTQTFLPASVSGGGLTWTSRVSYVPANESPCVIWTAVVGGSPSSMTVTVTFTAGVGSGSLGCVGVVEEWSGAALASSPALSTGTTDTTASYSATITPATVGAVISAMAADFNAVATAPTYLSGATTTNRVTSAGYVTLNGFSQAVTVAGTSQTFGMSAPAGQSVTLAAIEIIPSVVALPAAPLVVSQAVKRAATY